MGRYTYDRIAALRYQRRERETRAFIELMNQLDRDGVAAREHQAALSAAISARIERAYARALERTRQRQPPSDPTQVEDEPTDTRPD